MNKTKYEQMLNDMIDYVVGCVRKLENHIDVQPTTNTILTVEQDKLMTQFANYIAQARTFDIQASELELKDKSTRYAIEEQIKAMGGRKQ